MICAFCDEIGTHVCDLCDGRFCEDHGTPGTWVCGIETSACAGCGGFNADDAERKVAA